MDNQLEPVHVTLVKYDAGLGAPGIMPPQLSSSTEISVTPTGGRVVQQSFQDNQPQSKQERALGDAGVQRVVALVSELTELPARQLPGGSDVYGANTVVLVRRGQVPVWGYNPGGGCAADTEPELSVTSAHKTEFARILSELYEASRD
ncbi:hypothetical protein IWW55_003338 [Coemansia sp. RSA 2706]|nr:hypothetical protein LPJ63_002281 [Coemansia sp. RSA 2711]KAJ2302610.1 hypothetical protein IWW55_003338 [Coemansia sp. RSA 2706]KAJ2312754.1 hypothetical protein IWW54_001906 [Coemansia sp. RSA 2705]KAJ2713824.1 hypothetical protein H4R23_005887 [Coemansia sp. Cherry 401B]